MCLESPWIRICEKHMRLFCRCLCNIYSKRLHSYLRRVWPTGLTRHLGTCWHTAELQMSADLLAGTLSILWGAVLAIQFSPLEKSLLIFGWFSVSVLFSYQCVGAPPDSSLITLVIW